MHNLRIVLIAGATSATVSLFTIAVSSNSSAEEAAATDEVREYMLVQQVAAVDARCLDLENELVNLRLQSATVPTLRVAAEENTVDVVSVRAMVREALLEERLVGNVEGPESEQSSIGSRPAIELVADLGSLDREAAGDLWGQIAACNRLDDVLDVYRAAIAGAPQSLAAHHDLARAAHAAAMAAPNHKNGRLWGESDDAYSKVLELDPQRWDARYEKAVKLAFWPDTYGRLPEAMGHFETLIRQQRNMPVEPQHAQVYVWLGNLHAQQGDLEKAARVWREGQQRHPQDSTIRDRLATLGG